MPGGHAGTSLLSLSHSLSSMADHRVFSCAMSCSRLVGLVFACLAGASTQASDLVLTHARVYPAPDALPLEDATVLIHAGRIAALSSSDSTPAPRVPPGAQVLDCSGMSVTAGLWNSHVHILPVKLLHADRKTGAQLTSALQEMLTGWGFTSVFDVASILANTNNIRSRITAGEILGPRILTTGEPFFPRDGVPSYVKSYLEDNRITLPDDPSTAAAVARVRRQGRAGVDGIKIFAGSIEGDEVLPLRRDAAAGGEIVFGTDVGFICQFDTAEQYALMARAGMSFRQILASVPTN